MIGTIKRFPLLALILVISASCRQEDKRQQSDLYGESVLRDSLFGIELIEIPAGTLHMEKNLMEHSRDIHIESFYMGKYEVTQQQWRKVMGSYPPSFSFNDFPLDNARYDSTLMIRGSHYLHTKYAAAYDWSHSYSQVYPHHCVGFRLVREKTPD